MSDLLTNSQTNPQQYLQELYGIQFPEDFFHFWQFANEINPENPYELPINLTLVGPFEVLGEKVELENLLFSVRMHWRFYKDPPEFFTILSGNVDGLHFGYYYDDPNSLPGCVCSYYHNDAYDLGNAGATVFETVIDHIYYEIEASQESMENGEYTLEEFEEEIEIFLEFLEQIEDYMNCHSIPAPKERIETAQTWDEMGIVVPPHSYRPLTQVQTIDQLTEAKIALIEGFPGTTLKFAKDLWSLQDPEWEDHAIELMMAAYPALNRSLLCDILQEHLASRDPAINYIDFKPMIINGQEVKIWHKSR